MMVQETEALADRQSTMVALPNAPMPFNHWREEVVLDNGLEYKPRFR